MTNGVSKVAQDSRVAGIGKAALAIAYCASLILCSGSDFCATAAFAGTATSSPAQFSATAIVDNTTGFVGGPVTYTTQVQLAPGTYFLYITLTNGTFTLPATTGSLNPTSNNATLSAALQASSPTYFGSNLGMMIYPFTISTLVPANSTITFQPTSGNWTAVDNLANLKSGGSVAAILSIGSSKAATPQSDVDSAAGGNILVFTSGQSLTPKIAVSAGNAHTLALKADGTLGSWGSDSYGQLGIGTVISVSTPVKVGGIFGQMVDVEAGDGFNLSLGADGTVWSWGNDADAQLGDGTRSDRPTPMTISGLGKTTMIFAGSDHSLAIESDTTVWAWGLNNYGEVGDGTTDIRLAPVQVSGLTDVVGISAGESHSVAVKGDGTVWIWGGNYNGQLGDGTTNSSLVPEQVMSLPSIKAVSAGRFHTLALGADGTVWAWGLNGNSQLGDGTAVTRYTPVQVPGLSNVVQVYAGNYSSFAVTADGSVYGWGNNYFGSLGDGTGTQRSTPVLALISNVALVVAGEEHTLALKSDGTVWAWGENSAGQLGDGTTQNRFTPVQVNGLANVVAIAAGVQHSVAADSNSNVWAWGDNSTGELGYGFTDNRSTPQTIPLPTDVVAIAAGGEHSVALTGDGSVWTWGSNAAEGQLGDNTSTSRSSPGQVAGLTSVVGIAANLYHTLAVKSDGSVWAWGYNGQGQLGTGNLTNSFVPVAATGISNVVAVAAGIYNGFALKNDGTVWAWGANDYGQLGNGTTGGVSSVPVQVTGLSNIVAISAGETFAMALDGAGRIWAWGFNGDGELGNASYTDSSTPVQVIGIGNAVAISAGPYHAVALLADSTVSAWGYNGDGQLGDGTTTSRNIAAPVPGVSGVVAISANKSGNLGTSYSVAAKVDGTVIAWGNNFTGQLGDGTYAERLTPVIVLHEYGTGSLQTADWFLQLTSGIAATIPAGYIPSFELVAAASGSDTSKTVAANVSYNAADIGKTGSVFITARVPAGTLAGQGNTLWAPRGVAQLARGRTDNTGSAKRLAPRSRTSAPPGTSYTLIQLTPSGWQPVINGQLVPFATGVLGSALAAQTILNNTDTTTIPGAQFCLGYGVNASTMLVNGTVRNVVSVSGAPVGTVVTCIPGGTSVSPQSGYWWNPAEAGRGYVIEYNGTNIFMAAFLYDASGRSTWYGAGPAPLTGSTFSAPLSAYSGGQALTGSYRAPALGLSPGNISITFIDAADGTLTWPGGSIPISRFPIVTNGLNSPPTATQPQTGWWWNPNEGGRGYSIEVQNNTAFISAYMYDGSGNPVWYASGPAALTGDNTYQGSWTSYTGGQTLAGSYQPPTGTTNAGSLTVQFTSPTAATLTLPNGNQISIQRFGF